jgi:hypothetical protein
MNQCPCLPANKKICERYKKYIPLPNTFNLKNTIQLSNDLSDIPYDSDIKLASFDITNMYTNIPTDEFPSIILNVCNIN